MYSIHVCILKILKMYIKYFDRIDVSEGIDFNKTCASKG